MMLVDSHCHLNLLDPEAYPDGVAGVVRAALAAGVGHMLCVGTTLENSRTCLDFAREYPQVSASVGLHPNESSVELDEDALLTLAHNEEIVAIGETGLDYFRVPQEQYDLQQQSFRTHIQVARRIKKPLIVHTRHAQDATLEILRQENAASIGGVLHCFTEDLAMAQAAMEINFYISFSGIVTFKNAKDLQKVAMEVPLERLLIETDSPYLAPVPWRGKPNQPAYVRYVAQKIAELKSISMEEVCEQTTNNFCQLFGKRLA